MEPGVWVHGSWGEVGDPKDAKLRRVIIKSCWILQYKIRSIDKKEIQLYTYNTSICCLCARSEVKKTRTMRSSRRSRRGRNVSVFLCNVVAFWTTCVFSWLPTFANAAAKAITWAYSAQTVTMLTTDTLTISWSGTHDVYYSTTGTCSGGTVKAASSSSGSYTTTSGQMDVGTHYFYCSIGSHCSSGMYVTVNVTKGNSAILNPSDVSYTATDINGATKPADWKTDCSWGGTGSCGAGYCRDMSLLPKCDANELTSPNVVATNIDSP